MAKARNPKGQFVPIDGGPAVNQITDYFNREADRLEGLTNNARYSRSRLARAMSDERRNYNDECGYPDTEDITWEYYEELWERSPIARRVVDVWPDECWKITPGVFETEDAEEITAFEQAWDDLPRSLNPGSFYRGGEGSPVWAALRRLDIVSGIGKHGILLLGLDDGKPLSEPVDGINERGEPIGTSTERNLIYLKTYHENAAQVTDSERDPSNPRYGEPIYYNLEMKNGASMPVHWSRVIHVADNDGTPRMRPVYNRLMDLRKLYGGSGEMYWQGALPGLSFETHPQLGPNFPINQDKVRDAIERYFNGLQRYLALSGMTANSLAPQVVDPTPQINVQIEAICIQLTIPKRIFMGSERGELASGQDARAWNGRVRGRQVNHITPCIIAPLVDRLIAVGVLPTPEQYYVDWPDMSTVTAEERAAIAAKRTEAMVKYVQGGVNMLMAEMDYLTRELDYTQEEAEQILKTALSQEEPVQENVPGE